VVLVAREWNGRRKDRDGSRWPERAVGCCKRNRFQSLLGRNRGRLKSRADVYLEVVLHTRVVNGAFECFETFIFARLSTTK
jgi:hypothetical protein